MLAGSMPFRVAKRAKVENAARSFVSMGANRADHACEIRWLLGSTMPMLRITWRRAERMLLSVPLASPSAVAGVVSTDWRSASGVRQYSSGLRPAMEAARCNDDAQLARRRSGMSTQPATATRPSAMVGAVGTLMEDAMWYMLESVKYMFNENLP